MGAFWRIAGLVAGAATALMVTPAAAQGARVPVPPEGIAAFNKGEYGKAADSIVAAFDTCRSANPQGAACADIAQAIAVLVATAGNDKTEPMLLLAQSYIDTNVGRDSPDALAMLGAVTSYYDRLVKLEKYLPVAQRRLELARKLQGPTGRVAVIAAIGLCVVQWNLGQGQAAIDLLNPLVGKLPDTTPAELQLSGRVHDCIGMAYYSLDRSREAEPAFRRALALFERAEGETSELAIDAMASLANVLRKLDREDEARVIAARIDRLAKPDAQVRSRIDWAKGPATDPIAAARAALAAAEKQFGAQSPVTDMASADVGIALIDAGRMAEAEPYFERIKAAANNPANPASVRIKLLIGQITLTLKQDIRRFERAIPAIEQLVALAKSSGAGSDKILIDFQMYAGTSLLLSGQAPRAYPFLTDAGKLLLERLASYRDFDAAAQRETREYSPIFKFKVVTAWTLAQRQ